jgi:signal peptidase II
MSRATASPRIRVAAAWRAGLVAAIVLIIDRVTKDTIAAGIAAGHERKLIPGLKLVHVQNTGVAFSLFSSGGTLVLVITLVALGLLLTFFALHPDRPWLWLPTGLLLGGAVGNLIDRIANGSVTDFIKLPHWPAFNCADMAITFGVLTLLWVLERWRPE